MFGQKLNDAQLKQYVREIPSGGDLFRAGEVGKTMFLVLQGSVGLFDTTRDGKELLIGKIGWGQVVGEQSIVGEPPYHRIYTARSLSWTRALEFDIEGMKFIEKIVPDFSLRILQITAKWLNRTNQIINILRPTHSVERFIRCLCFLATQEEVLANTNTHNLTVDHIEVLSGIDPFVIQDYLSHLVTHKIITEMSGGYRINNPPKFVEELLALRDELEAAARPLTLRAAA